MVTKFCAYTAAGDLILWNRDEICPLGQTVEEAGITTYFLGEMNHILHRLVSTPGMVPGDNPEEHSDNLSGSSPVTTFRGLSSPRMNLRARLCSK